MTADRSERLGLSVGDRVLIRPPHAWAGHVGTVVRIVMGVMGDVAREGAVVQLDGQAGFTAGLLERTHFRRVDAGRTD